jgi:hypothetical protein
MLGGFSWLSPSYLLLRFTGLLSSSSLKGLLKILSRFYDGRVLMRLRGVAKWLGVFCASLEKKEALG